MKLVLPMANVSISNGKPIFFLAGPIRGGGDWQKEAVLLLEKKMPNAYIVCPCRWREDHELYACALPDSCAVPGAAAFGNQTAWERHYLQRASQQGAVIFWLPQEDKMNPRPPETGPYARDTYGELGEWRMKIRHENAKVVVGAEREFPGLSVIVKNFNVVVRGGGFPFYATLSETITQAVALAGY